MFFFCTWAAARLCGCDPIVADVVQTTGGGVRQGQVDPQLTPRAPESVGQRLSGRRRLCVWRSGRGRGIWVLLFALRRGRGAAAGAARVPGPHTRSHLQEKIGTNYNKEEQKP